MKRINFTRVALNSAVISAFAASMTGCVAPAGMVQQNTDQMNSVLSQVSKSAPSTAFLPISAKTPGTNEHAQYLASKQSSVARKASRPWIGARMVEVQSDENLPPIFYKAQNFNFKDPKGKEKRVPLRVVAERITAITGIPIRIAISSTSQIAPGKPATQLPGMPALPATPMPSPLPPEGVAPMPAAGAIGVPLQDSQTEFVTNLDSVSMQWNGHPAGFLDFITNQLGLSWSYRGGTVMIEKMLTETFELAAFGVEQTFKMELTGGSSGGANDKGTTTSNQSTLQMSEAGKVETLKSLQKAFESVVRPVGGEVVLNETTGRFYVTAPKDAMTKVRQIFKAEDDSLMRQAHIQIDIYSVVRDDSNEAGIDWNIAFESLSNAWGATLSSPGTLTGAIAGGMSTTIMQNASNTREFANSKAILKMLNSVGSTAKHAPVSLVAMNRQWARKTNLKTDGYLSETTPSTSSSAGSGAPGLKTSQITTGDKFMVTPAILDSGTILLKFGLSLTELVGMFDVSAGQGQSFQKVQTPVTTGTDDQSTVRLEPGQAMVVTGLSRKINGNDKRTLGDGVPMFMGGSRKITNAREDFVVVIRAVQMQ
ncbi:hypothetical protein [Comamonas thiooxydans]|uniref:hypothetical protein n=1 Tax=Comamonas thiooxydans TaxID=363952 RepID=UPI00050F8D69|nr:hypothetical protein [Comamonas thiooxydans]KGH23052.1 hypothetical protein P606_13540 [Comamonas thiooxydans]